MTARTILIVDDDPDIRELFALQLRGEGYKIAAAPDGITGLSIAQKNPPDLVLLDICLPGGDGLTVLQRLKNIQRLQSIPVIVITGETSTQCRDAALEGAAEEFLAKPVDPDELVAAVHRVLGDAAPDDGEACPHCGRGDSDGEAAIDPATIRAIALEAARAAVREFAATFRKKATVGK